MHTSYIIMWSYPGIMPKYYPGLRDILPDLCTILAYYLDKTTLLYEYCILVYNIVIQYNILSY